MTLTILNIYDPKVENYIKKLRDITSKICKVDPTNEEASENYISYLMELEFKVISIRKSIHSYVDLLDSKSVCESVVLKSNSVVGFPDTHPKLQVPCRKLSSVYKKENKSILSDPCHYSNPDHPHSSASKSGELKSVLSDLCHYPFSKHKQSFVLNQNDSKSNLSDLSRKLSPSHKEFSVSKLKNVSKPINRQMENTKTNENSFSICSSQSTNWSSLSSETVSSASHLAIYE